MRCVSHSLLKRYRWRNVGELSARAHLRLRVAAERAYLYVSFLIEDYSHRTAHNLRSDIGYLVGKFGSSPALLRTPTADRALPARPWVFVHDTYRLTPADLASLFKRGGGQSVRGTPIDVVALGLYFKQPVTRDHLLQARSSRRL